MLSFFGVVRNWLATCAEARGTVEKVGHGRECSIPSTDVSVILGNSLLVPANVSSRQSAYTLVDLLDFYLALYECARRDCFPDHHRSFFHTVMSERDLCLNFNASGR